MKKKIFAVVCVILCLAIIMPTVAFAYESNLCLGDIPTICISGQGTTLVKEAGNRDSEVIYPFSVDARYLIGAAKKVLPQYIKGVLTDNWKGYSKALSDAIVEAVKDVALDKNGNVVDGSGANNQNVGNISDPKYAIVSVRSFDETSANCYSLKYDWRLDPCEVADQLKGYIEHVKFKAGSEKVNVVARCLGVNIMLAYLDKYGSSDLNKLILYASGFDGIETIGQIFTGKIVLDADMIEGFSNGFFVSGDNYANPIFEIIRYTLSLYNKVGALKINVRMIQEVYDKVYRDIYPEIFLNSFGTMPGFWCYVGDEYYEDAKKTIFADRKDEYSELIKKIDYYHYSILNRSGEIVENAAKNGLDTYIIAKYGFSMIPITNKAKNVQSDSLVYTTNSSLGATCSKVDERFGLKYMVSSIFKGTYKYISPDRKIDASTCLLKDKTWFVKNVAHRDMPECVFELISDIIYFDGEMTVFNNKKYSQFLVADDETEHMYKQNIFNTNVDRKNKVGLCEAVFGIFVSTYKAILGIITDIQN